MYTGQTDGIDAVIEDESERKMECSIQLYIIYISLKFKFIK